MHADRKAGDVQVKDQLLVIHNFLGRSRGSAHPVRHAVALFLLTALPLFGQTFQGYTNVTDGLVGWWRFNEGTGTTANDGSGVGNHGTLSGTTLPMWTNGVNGNALYFSNGIVTIPATTFSTNNTLAFWIYPIACGSTHYGALLVNVPGSNEISWNDSISGHYETIAYYSAGAQFANNNCVRSNVWSHVAISGLVLYVNGVSTFTFSNRQASFSAVNIGYQGSLNDVFFGKLDDIRIYNRALSSEEVKILYNRGFGQ